MLDLDGKIALSREDLALEMNKQKHGEEISVENFVLVAKIIEENKEMPMEFKTYDEIDMDHGTGCASPCPTTLVEAKCQPQVVAVTPVCEQA